MVVGKKKRMKERMRKGGESEVGRTVVGKKKERMRERMRMGNGGERIGINYGFDTVAWGDIFGRELKQPQLDTCPWQPMSGPCLYHDRWYLNLCLIAYHKKLDNNFVL